MNHVETGKTHKTLLLVTMMLAFPFCRPSGVLSGFPLSRSVSLLAIEHFKGKRMCLGGSFITAYQPWGSPQWVHRDAMVWAFSYECRLPWTLLGWSPLWSCTLVCFLTVRRLPMGLMQGVSQHSAFNIWALVCGPSGLVDWTKCPFTAASSCYRILSFHVGLWRPSVHDI